MWPMRFDNPALPTIYVVDDDSDFVIVLEKYLIKRFSVNVKTFNSPTDAFDHLKNCKIAPDLIICDIKMPEIDGFHFRKVSRNSGVDVPFIFLSAAQKHEFDEGDYTILCKPVRMNHLEDLIARFITLERKKA